MCVVSIGDELSRELRGQVKQSGIHVHSWSVDASRENAKVTVECELRWRAREREPADPALIESLRKRADVERVRWQVAG